MKDSLYKDSRTKPVWINFRGKRIKITSPSSTRKHSGWSLVNFCGDIKMCHPTLRKGSDAFGSDSNSYSEYHYVVAHVLDIQEISEEVPC